MNTDAKMKNTSRKRLFSHRISSSTLLFGSSSFRIGDRSSAILRRCRSFEMITRTQLVLLLVIMISLPVRSLAESALQDELEYSDSTNGLQQQPFTFTRLAPNKSSATPNARSTGDLKSHDFHSNSPANSSESFRALQPFTSRRLKATNSTQTTVVKSTTASTIKATAALSIGDLLLQPLPKSLEYHSPNESNANHTGGQSTTNNQTLAIELHPLDSQKWDASTSKPAFGSPTEQHSVMINHGGGAISTVRRSLLNNGPFVHHLQVGFPSGEEHFAPIEFDQINFNDDFTPPPPMPPPTRSQPHPDADLAPLSPLPSPLPPSTLSYRTGSTVKPHLPQRHLPLLPKRIGFAAIQPENHSRRGNSINKPLNRGGLNRPSDRPINSSPTPPSSPSPQHSHGNYPPMGNIGSLRPADLPNYAELSFFGYSLDQKANAQNDGGPNGREFSNKDQYTHDDPPLEPLQRRPLFSERLPPNAHPQNHQPAINPNNANHNQPNNFPLIVPNRRARDFEQFDKPPLNVFQFEKMHQYERNGNAFQPAAPPPTRHAPHHSNNNHNGNHNQAPPANEFHLSNFFSRDAEDAQPPSSPPTELFSLFDQPPFGNGNGYQMPFDNRYTSNAGNGFNAIPSGRNQLLQRRKLSTPSQANGPLLNEISNNQLGYGYPNYNVFKSDDDLGGAKWPKIFKFTDGRVNLNDFERDKKLGKVLFTKSAEDGEFFEHVRRDSFLILHGGSFQY